MRGMLCFVIFYAIFSSALISISRTQKSELARWSKEEIRLNEYFKTNNENQKIVAQN